MSFTLRDKTEIKIFVLYLLMNAEEPVDFVTLHDMVVQDAVVGQFDFMDSFFELAETAAVQKIEMNGKEYFTVTPSGREAARMLENDLSKSVRERALRSAKYICSTVCAEQRREAVSSRLKTANSVWNANAATETAFI